MQTEQIITIQVTTCWLIPKLALSLLGARLDTIGESTIG